MVQSSDENVDTEQSTEPGRISKTCNQSSATKCKTLNDRENIGNMELWCIFRTVVELLNQRGLRACKV